MKESQERPEFYESSLSGPASLDRCDYMSKWATVKPYLYVATVYVSCTLCRCMIRKGMHVRLVKLGKSKFYVHEDCYNHWS